MSQDLTLICVVAVVCWSARGEKAVTITPSTRATSHTVFGAISAVGAVKT